MNGSSFESESIGYQRYHHDTIGNRNGVRVIRPQPIRPQHHNYRSPVGVAIHEQTGLQISNGVMVNTTLDRRCFNPFRYVQENVIFLSC